MRTRNIAIGGGFIVGLAIALSMGQGQLGGGGLPRVITSSDFAGSGTTSNPLDMSTAVTLPGSLAVVTTTNLQGAVSNSTGTLTLSDDVTLGADASSVISFTNGPSGVNLYGGKHLEYAEEFMMGVAPPNAGQFEWWSSDVVSSTITMGGTTTRPGILVASTAASATARFMAGTSTDMLDLSQYTTSTFEWVGGVDTLSTSSEEYQLLVGFTDSRSSVNITDGCYFLYDRGGVATDPATGDSGASALTGDKWQIWCVQNSTRTGYLLDGTASEDSFTTVDSAVAALTLPSTNIYHLKVVLDAASKAHFWINGVEVGRITTNIPTGSSRLTGAGALYIKSTGTTARISRWDAMRFSLDMSAARSP
jgi:hypothetical protein